MRGQAFETMMLVISVIVAIAILGVLLNILNIGGSLFNPSNPTDTMKNGLKRIQSSGYGITTPQKVSFSPGTVVTRGELTADLPILPKDIKFYCKGSDICGQIIDTAGDKLTVKGAGKIEVNVVVCGNPGHTGNPYCIGIARKADDATDACAGTGGCNVQ